MFVDDAPACRLVGVRDSQRRLPDIVVEHGGSMLLVAPEEALQQHRELVLSLRHPAEEGDQEPQVSLALPLNRGRRVGLRGAQICAI